MTTLQAIGFTAAGGGIVTAFTFAFFAVAVRSRSPNVAPRCTARAKDTIFNPKARKGKRSFYLFGSRRSLNSQEKKNDDDGGGGIDYDGDDDGSRTKEEVQYRGGPMLGWIPWSLSLSYDQLLKGVPGTGTRKDGMEGSMLKVNLDGIILLRFHALCLRVSIVATIIGIGMVLPLNLTAQCFSSSGEDLYCNATNYTLTNYEQTTLANIPSLEAANSDDGDHWLFGWFGSTVDIFGSEYSSYLGRLYAIVFFSWILVFYTIHLMKNEWVDVLAMRRVYYLEGAHWENRVNELNETVLNYADDDSSEDEEKPGAQARRRLANKKKRKKKKSREHETRDPWIPHPEQRETVPNIELYSVIVGNIPIVPSEVAADGDLESMDPRSDKSVDWQLAVTVSFFDQCIPNQPGFSSSVAAVTILPDAPKLAKAWRTWYRHVGLLRRLRFIKSLIARRRHFDHDEVEGSDVDAEELKTLAESSAPLGDGKSLDVLFPLDDTSPSKEETKEEEEIQSLSCPIPHNDTEDHLDVSPASGESSLDRREEEESKQLQLRIDYYSDVFGARVDKETLETTKTLVAHALSYGPEQTAVYSREFAQGAAACCPNGCREERLHSLTLAELEELQAEVEEAVENSFEDLLEAQNSNLDRKRQDALEMMGELDKLNTFDVENELYDRTPKKFSSQDQNGNLSRYKRDEMSIQGIQEGVAEENPSFVNTVGITGSENHVSNTIALTNQGRIYFRESAMFHGRPDSGEEGENPAGNAALQFQSPINISNRGDLEAGDAGLRTRQRLNTGMSQMSIPDGIDNWEKVKMIVQDDDVVKGSSSRSQRRAFSGVWKIPSISKILQKMWKRVTSFRKQTKVAVEEFASESKFAVVTFTSRQAAVAARHCLADGRGANRWTPVEDIPVPPLADAASFDFKTCRGCCRPVTMSLNSKQQFVRKYTALFILLVMYVFYTVPLTFISTLAAPEKLNRLIPGLSELAEDNPVFNRLLQGVVPSLLYSLFFALCPVIFKAISNFGSNAISVNEAEFIALQYYWYFMLFTAFSGTSLANLALAYLNERQQEGNSFTSVLVEIANRLPGTVSSVWLNWIILRTSVILPLQYMLQVNTFIFQWIGWKCCRRCVMGGGPGGPIPYRIYIDSGVVFMCIVALVPVSPLVAPAALIYFLYCTPLWRRNVVYLYRPKFDTGGLRWPFLSDILISSLCVAQVLMTTVMALKKATGPAVFSAMPIISLIVHRRFIRKRFLRSYLDAALLQTSDLDGWDNRVPTSIEKRNEYRKFLVDAHKAAYVPICIAGGSTARLTAEPALVVPHENDVLIPEPISSDDMALKHASIHSLDRSPTFGSMATPVQLARQGTSQRLVSTKRLKPLSLAELGLASDSMSGILGNMHSQHF